MCSLTSGPPIRTAPATRAVEEGSDGLCAVVTRALANSLAPGAVNCRTPDWLRPDQDQTVRRVIHALALFRGCLLADPVGTGKTYIALAVATLVNGERETCCIVPPALVGQWQSVARRLGVAIRAWSHARLSRMKPPPPALGLVIIDESHHFRNPGTVRYRTLAPWITGKPALMLSATPVVNRADDLVHQLSLAVRSDALRPCGVGSLKKAICHDRPHTALGNLIIVGSERGDRSLPGVLRSAWRWPAGERSDLVRGMDIIRKLRLAVDGSVAPLLRGLFWQALASSPEALHSAAKRYQSLLHHAHDAAAEGRSLSRAMLRDVISDTPEQLVMWSLLTTDQGPNQLPQSDLPIIAELVLATKTLREEPDDKVQALNVMLGDGTRSLVFVNFTSTVDYLRRHLRGVPLAWCTGSAAGIGSARVAREDVLAFFRPGDAAAGTEHLAPRVLITTDVAAEGLDLHTAERVVHYDLPWHEVRIEQRNGRAVRAGSIHRSVTVVRFEPHPSVDRELQLLENLGRKELITNRLGLSPAGRDRWRWRSRVAEELGGSPECRGIARAPLGPRGTLVGLSVRGGYRALPGLRDCPRALEVARWFPGTPSWYGILAWLDGSGWTEDPDLVTERLIDAQACSLLLRPSRADRDHGLAAARRVGREIEERLRRGRWAATQPTPGLRPLIHRLRNQAVRAARDRDGATLRRLDDALRFLAGGHTAGEEALIAMLSRSDPGALGSMDLPLADSPLNRAEIHLVGLIVFRPE